MPRNYNKRRRTYQPRSKYTWLTSSSEEEQEAARGRRKRRKRKAGPNVVDLLANPNKPAPMDGDDDDGTDGDESNSEFALATFMQLRQHDDSIVSDLEDGEIGLDELTGQVDGVEPLGPDQAAPLIRVPACLSRSDSHIDIQHLDGSNTPQFVAAGRGGNITEVEEFLLDMHPPSNDSRSSGLEGVNSDNDPDEGEHHDSANESDADAGGDPTDYDGID